MGADFTLLLQAAPAEPAVRELCTTLADLPACSQWSAAGFRPLEATEPAWRSYHEDQSIEHVRAGLRDRNWFLDAPGGFHFTFAHDAIRVGHLLRWDNFVEQQAWFDAMVASSNAIAAALGAPRVVASFDEHSIFQAFFAGQAFAHCVDGLASGSGVDEIDRQLIANFEQVLPDLPASWHEQGVIWLQGGP